MRRARLRWLRARHVVASWLLWARDGVWWAARAAVRGLAAYTATVAAVAAAVPLIALGWSQPRALAGWFWPGAGSR